MLSGELLDGRFEALDVADYDVPGVERQHGRDTRLNTAVVIDSITAVAPTAVRRSALRAMSVRDPRLARVIAVTGGSATDPTVIVSEPLPGVTLTRVLERHRLDEGRAKAVVGEATRALQAAAAAGVHHGWLRPACVAVDARGRVVVAGTGVEGELALQAGVRRGKGERADATALSRLFLACVTGRDADEATAADIPAGTSPQARAVCEGAIAGEDVASLSALLEALGPFDTRALRGLPSGIDSLPLSLRAAAEAQRRRARERVEAAERAYTRPRVTGGVTIARETLAKAEAEAVSGAIPLVREEPQAEPHEDLHDLITLEEMVDDQVARAKPTTAELFYGRLHRRWPQSRRITARLERARDRAINGGPINATPILMALVIVGLVGVVLIALNVLGQGFAKETPPGPGVDVYPTFSYEP